MTAAAGDDDVIPRAYRDGDELRRVHWRSTARYGELMVRREEQRWQDRAVLILDSRRSAHIGSGPSSSFEFAVSAAASIGVHLARSGPRRPPADRRGAAGRLGDVRRRAARRAVGGRQLAQPRLRQDDGGAEHDRGRAARPDRRPALRRRGQGDRDRARHGRQGIALLLAVSTWAAQPARSRQGGGTDQDDHLASMAPMASTARTARTGRAARTGSAPDTGTAQERQRRQEHTRIRPCRGRRGNRGGGRRPRRRDWRWHGRSRLDRASRHRKALIGDAALAETAAAAAVLRAAGWRVITVDATTPLAVAWQQLPRSG